MASLSERWLYQLLGQKRNGSHRRLRLVGCGGTRRTVLALDRLKPFPLDRIEGIPGSIGVMLDDISMGLALGLAVTIGVRLGAGCPEAASRPGVFS